jgi:hypothetical protein
MTITTIGTPNCFPFGPAVRIRPRNRDEVEHGTRRSKQASDRAQPDRDRNLKQHEVRTEGRVRRGEGKGQRKLLLLLKLLLIKRCLRRWELGKDEFPEAMAAAARRLANAASTAGIVSSPDARNAVLCREIQLG